MTLLKKCQFNCDKWYEFGAYLNISLNERKRLKKELTDTFEMLEEILEQLITSDHHQPSWDKIISAVEKCGQQQVADNIIQHIKQGNV